MENLQLFFQTAVRDVLQRPDCDNDDDDDDDDVPIVVKADNCGDDKSPDLIDSWTKTLFIYNADI